MTDILPTQVRRSVDVDAPVDDVWDVIVDDEERAGWFGGPTELIPEVGAPATFTEPDGTRRSARVSSVVPGRHLGWTWWDDGDDEMGSASRVTIDLTPSPDGTRIDITEMPLQATMSVVDGPFGGMPFSGEHGPVDPVLELEHRLLIRAASLFRHALGA